MRIRPTPAFNEFDAWQSYKPEEPIKSMSLYIVEASAFDLFFNKRYNLCYGNFLQANEAMPRNQSREAPDHH